MAKSKIQKAAPWITSKEKYIILADGTKQAVTFNFLFPSLITQTVNSYQKTQIRYIRIRKQNFREE